MLAVECYGFVGWREWLNIVWITSISRFYTYRKDKRNPHTKQSELFQQQQQSGPRSSPFGSGRSTNKFCWSLLNVEKASKNFQAPQTAKNLIKSIVWIGSSFPATTISKRSAYYLFTLNKQIDCALHFVVIEPKEVGIKNRLHNSGDHNDYINVRFGVVSVDLKPRNEKIKLCVAILVGHFKIKSVYPPSNIPFSACIPIVLKRTIVYNI